MPRQVCKELAYDAPLEAVAEMLADQTFRERVLERQRVISGSVKIEGDEVRVEQVKSRDEIAPFARRFTGAEIPVHQHERWTTPSTADVTVTVPGTPGEVSGTIVLAGPAGTTGSPTGSGTVETVELRVSVRIPVVGGRLEGMICDMLADALDSEHEVGVEWLRGER